ncbi:hypothetical protein [Celeribacter sp. SCSIO 80788]|uniref:hypothetical protein n=1 Tax=Celeribacter sp. SCSIO 80788 TaxID=3117013 RepID=UPI003DA2D5B4
MTHHKPLPLEERKARQAKAKRKYRDTQYVLSSFKALYGNARTEDDKAKLCDHLAAQLERIDQDKGGESSEA